MNPSILLSSIVLAGAPLVLTSPASASDTACDPRVLQSPTKFPERSQLRGQKGTVLVEVVLDAAGRARQARVLESSGYRLLDRAALQSIRTGWRFDVSACAPPELPVDHVVAVEFRNGESAPKVNGTPELAHRF